LRYGTSGLLTGAVVLTRLRDRIIWPRHPSGAVQQAVWVVVVASLMGGCIFANPSSSFETSFWKAYDGLLGQATIAEEIELNRASGALSINQAHRSILAEIDEVQVALKNMGVSEAPNRWTTATELLIKAMGKHGLGLVSLDICVTDNDTRSCGQTVERFWSRDCFLSRASEKAPEGRSSIGPPVIDLSEDPDGDCVPNRNYDLTLKIDGNSWVSFAGHLVVVDAMENDETFEISGAVPQEFPFNGRSYCVRVEKTSSTTRLGGVEGVFYAVVFKDGGPVDVQTQDESATGREIMLSGGFPEPPEIAVVC